MLEQVALFGGAKPYSETPTDAARSTQQLDHGDVLVLATDGVWDNLSAEDALRLVTRVMLRFEAWVIPEGKDATPGVSPKLAEIAKSASVKVPGESSSVTGLSAVLATALTHEAKTASLDRKRDGPFAREVQRLYPEENWRGGKADDICVVVAVVLQNG
jgi:protein phosphatase PTC7